MIFNLDNGASNLVHLIIAYDQSLAGATITATNGTEVHTAVANNSGLTVINGTKLGNWTVSENRYNTSSSVNANYYGNYNVGLGGGVSITVEFSTAFVGKVLTLTNGSKSYTKTATGSSVLFIVDEYGTWTVSAVVEDNTYSNSVVVTEDGSYSIELLDTPEGSTVTPTGDIQIWLRCAGLSKNYTTIAQVLGDTSTLSALISDNNAVDYMARSTTWASSVVSNPNAMSYIGLNDYCANKLLANNTWLTAICGSTYFESVLNVKVPTMTSYTAPSGQVIYSSAYSADYAGYKAFNGDAKGWAVKSDASTHYIGYKFTTSVICKAIWVHNRTNNTLNLKLQGSDNGNEWTDLSDVMEFIDDFNEKVSVLNNENYTYYRLYGNFNSHGSGVKIQFYGREA